MANALPLLADIWDVAKAIIPLLLLVFWVLSQVMGQKNEAPRPQRPAGGAGGGAKPQDDPNLRDEIEVFLRQAQRNQGEQGRGAPPRREDQPDPTEKRRKLERKREMARQRAVDIANSSRRIGERVEIVEAESIEEPRQSVAQHVRSYMDQSSMTASAGHLGEDVGQADERLEARLHATFDHQVGQLATQPGEAERRGAGSYYTVVNGQQLAAMMRNPASMRNAIILTEVVNRPEHLWT